MKQIALGAQAIEGLSKNKAAPYVIGGVVIIGLGIAYFGVIKPVLCSFGVMECKKDKKIRDLMSYKGFDPNYSNPSRTTISHARAKQLAIKLYRAGNLFNDNEGAFYAVLEEAGSADNLSLISRMFTAKTGGSLAEHITYYMDDARELERIKDIINSY